MTASYESGTATGYGVSYRRRTKSVWAGTSLGDAFKPNVEYFLRRPALRRFYKMCLAEQKHAAACAGEAIGPDFEPKIKPQLSPCLTSYPATVAVYAAIGLTGYLEYRNRAPAVLRGGVKTPRSVLAAFLAGKSVPVPDPALAGDASPREARLMAIISHAVESRLVLEAIAKTEVLQTTEIYRLFFASQQTLKFRTFSEVIHAVVTCGDLLPPWDRTHRLHPVTRRMLKELQTVSRPYFKELASSKVISSEEGQRWVQEIFAVLKLYLPASESSSKTASGRPGGGTPGGGSAAAEDGAETPEPSAGALSTPLAPLDAPRPPVLSEPSVSIGMSAVDDSEEPDAAVNRVLQALSAALEKAGGQKAGAADIRSDVLERMLREKGFETGPVEGNLADVHEIETTLGDKDVAGEIFDEPVPLSENVEQVERLLREASPIAEELRSMVYPNLEEQQEMKRFRVSGRLDPSRLPLADLSQVIYRRSKTIRKPDRRGRPVLAFVLDASGSVARPPMRLLKVLTAAWLQSTLRSNVQIMAALYNTGAIRSGLSGPLVRWVCHPSKTPATGPADAVRAVAGLPDSGSGGQCDALSLEYILREARQLSRGRAAIYLVLISDAGWCASYPGCGETPLEEVRGFFQHARTEMGDKLNTTLVVLGKSGYSELDGVVDRVICATPKELLDYTSMARKIARYVASCMRARKGKQRIS